jgi:hypothetical protein
VKVSPVLYGIASGGMVLRRRSSAGSMPSRRAAKSKSCSVTVVAIGWPTPRSTPLGGLFWK